MHARDSRGAVESSWTFSSQLIKGTGDFFCTALKA